jgi:hypothetical protein
MESVTAGVCHGNHARLFWHGDLYPATAIRHQPARCPLDTIPIMVRSPLQSGPLQMLITRQLMATGSMRSLCTRWMPRASPDWISTQMWRMNCLTDLHEWWGTWFQVIAPGCWTRDASKAYCFCYRRNARRLVRTLLLVRAEPGGAGGLVHLRMLLMLDTTPSLMTGLMTRLCRIAPGNPV